MGYNVMRTIFCRTREPKMSVNNALPSDCKTLDEFLGSLSYNKDRKEMYIPAMDEVCAFDDMQITEQKPFTIIKLSNVRTVNPFYCEHFDTVVMTYKGKVKK